MKSKISFLVRATGPGLLFSTVLDGQKISSSDPVSDFQLVEIEIADDVERSHTLELEMSGKTEDHTKIDDQGNILEDRVIEIKDFAIEEIHLGHVFTQNAKYVHDFNGTRDTVEEIFYGTMGCNGRVRFEFSTPVYLWLLENM